MRPIRIARVPGPFRRLGAKATSTIEFALTAPILLSVLLGVSDLAPTTMAQFKLGNATESVADLSTQFAQLQASDMADVFAGGIAVLAPYSSTTLSMRVTNVASDGKGNAFVYWSCATGSYVPYVAKSSVTTTPSGTSIDNVIYRYTTPSIPYSYNGTNTSYVSVESTYSYSAPARFVLTSPVKMVVVNYNLPRVSTYIGFPWDGNPNHASTAPTATTTTKTMTLSNGAVCNYSA